MGFNAIANTIQNMTSHLCCILVTDLIVFCLYPEESSEAEFKNDRLSCLAEKFSRPHNIQATLLLLLIAFIQIYHVKEEQEIMKIGESKSHNK